MKKIITPALVIISFALYSFCTLIGLPLGSELPKADVKLKDVSGKEISMKDAAGKNGILVMFSCNTCPYVVKNEKRILEISSFAKSSGLGIVIINSNEANRNDGESYDDMKDYAASQGYQCNYVIDSNSEIADAFDAKKTPECFLFNNKLSLVYHGAIDDNPSDISAVTRKHLQEAISELISGKDISVKESRSVGCSIKRKG